ncbi:UNVERIFIED_CONTAM: hypothetical protein GTU68_055950 [Idotea baltica]|nr:hypothetical protein [Idotea baltica]
MSTFCTSSSLGLYNFCTAA